MTSLDCLQALKEFIEEEVANEMWLLKEGTEKEYVHPYVCLMTLPHKNFIPVDFTIPNILIGLNEGNDDGGEHSLSIRILCATYSCGKYEGGLKLPDEKGYIDLLNLIERIKLRLVESATIKGKGVVEKPISYGIYSEQVTYPYSYGYLTFRVQIPVNEYPINKYL